jgi:hypothetical protein
VYVCFLCQYLLTYSFSLIHCKGQNDLSGMSLLRSQHSLVTPGVWYLIELAKKLTLLTCIWEVPSSNLGQDTDCPD